jgi:hypothetical protein
MKVLITAGEVSASAELLDTPTGKAIGAALPIEGRANVWGDEIYFEIPVEMSGEEDARADVEVGELGYWPPGSAFCIFFGPTPVSPGEAPRAASPVNVFGKVEGDATIFRQVAGGARVVITRAG